jgi:hypothetical protein
VKITEKREVSWSEEVRKRIHGSRKLQPVITQPSRTSAINSSARLSMAFEFNTRPNSRFRSGRRKLKVVRTIQGQRSRERSEVRAFLSEGSQGFRRCLTQFKIYALIQCDLKNKDSIFMEVELQPKIRQMNQDRRC